MRLVTASEMANLDRQTIEEIGIPGIVLMENAANGAAGFFLEVLPDLLQRRITVLAGSGNNAGDGFVLARIFSNKGAEVRIICLRSPEKLRGDALTNFRIIEKLNIPVVVWDEQEDFDKQWKWVRKSDVIIDAIFGTGLNSEVRGVYRQVIEALGSLSIPVLAVDVPSGVDASTGKIMGAAVRARATATFGLPKVGQVIPPGDEYVGRLSVVDIGIPPKLVDSSGIRRWWLDEDLASSWVKPRSSSIHKGQAGRVAVLSGSPGKTGAATLISRGATRVGAGLVTLFIPESLNPILEVKLTEEMTYPIAETEARTAAETALPEILGFLKGHQALAMGPGISLHPETATLVKALVPQCPCPMVLDADALTILSEHLDILRQARHPPILTPHPGEMSRLIHGSIKAVQEDRVGLSLAFSRDHGAILVLKGHRTIIAAPDGRLAINGSGNPAMATGGVGDTLTGMIAGFVGQGYEPFQAACLAVYVHGAAADKRIGKVATRGLAASDILEEVPSVIGRLEGFKGCE